MHVSLLLSSTDILRGKPNETRAMRTACAILVTVAALAIWTPFIKGLPVELSGFGEALSKSRGFEDGLSHLEHPGTDKGKGGYWKAVTRDDGIVYWVYVDAGS